MPTRRRMERGLYDARGHRKYLTTAERTAFLTAAEETPREVRTLCSLLAHTGCRVSEALGLTADRVDLRAELMVFEALVGFQGRGVAEVVHPDFCHALLRHALLFQWPSERVAMLGQGGSISPPESNKSVMNDLLQGCFWNSITQ
jgi:integrase